MKFVIQRTASDELYESIKNFQTVDQLIKFMEQEKHPLIIMTNIFYKDKDIYVPEIANIPYAIEIYDDYRE